MCGVGAGTLSFIIGVANHNKKNVRGGLRPAWPRLSRSGLLMAYSRAARFSLLSDKNAKPIKTCLGNELGQGHVATFLGLRFTCNHHDVLEYPFSAVV